MTMTTQIDSHVMTTNAHSRAVAQNITILTVLKCKGFNMIVIVSRFADKLFNDCFIKEP